MDRKLLTAALALPAALLFSAAAVASGLSGGVPADGTPIAYAAEGETCVEVPIEVELHADDANGDIVLYQLTEQPRLGSAQIEGSTLTYTPARRAGTDRFSFTVVDADGRIADAAPVTITIRKNRAGLTYSDMTGDAAHYAAIRLAEAGVMTGESIGGCAFFRPNQTVSRSEFIAMAATVAALPVTPTEQTDFADDSGLSPWAKPFVSTAAASGLIAGYPSAAGITEVRGQNPITLAEASAVLDRMLEQTPLGTAYVSSDAHAADGDWAQQAVSCMERLDILPADSGMQQPDSAITRRTACEMLYRTMKLMQ